MKYDPQLYRPHLDVPTQRQIAPYTGREIAAVLIGFSVVVALVLWRLCNG